MSDFKTNGGKCKSCETVKIEINLMVSEDAIANKLNQLRLKDNSKLSWWQKLIKTNKGY